MTLAPQVSPAAREGGAATFPRFDWGDGAIVARLCFGDLCAVLQVLRGERESIEDGRGLFHRSAVACQSIRLGHFVDPFDCYRFEVCEVPTAGAERREVRVSLSSAEALGLYCIFQQSLSSIVFG